MIEQLKTKKSLLRTCDSLQPCFLRVGLFPVPATWIAAAGKPRLSCCLSRRPSLPVPGRSRWHKALAVFLHHPRTSPVYGLFLLPTPRSENEHRHKKLSAVFHQQWRLKSNPTIPAAQAKHGALLTNSAGTIGVKPDAFCVTTRPWLNTSTRCRPRGDAPLAPGAACEGVQSPHAMNAFSSRRTHRSKAPSCSHPWPRTTIQPKFQTLPREKSDPRSFLSSAVVLQPCSPAQHCWHGQALLPSSLLQAACSYAEESLLLKSHFVAELQPLRFWYPYCFLQCFNSFCLAYNCPGRQSLLPKTRPTCLWLQWTLRSVGDQRNHFILLLPTGRKTKKKKKIRTGAFAGNEETCASHHSPGTGVGTDLVLEQRVAITAWWQNLTLEKVEDSSKIPT